MTNENPMCELDSLIETTPTSSFMDGFKPKDQSENTDNGVPSIHSKSFNYNNNTVIESYEVLKDNTLKLSLSNGDYFIIRGGKEHTNLKYSLPLERVLNEPLFEITERWFNLKAYHQVCVYAGNQLVHIAFANDNLTSYSTNAECYHNGKLLDPNETEEYVPSCLNADMVPFEEFQNNWLGASHDTEN